MRRASIAGRDGTTRFGGVNGYSGCSARGAVCLHWGLLGTACQFRKLAGVRDARHLWVTPKASILTVVIGGFFIFPLTQMLLRLPGRRASVSRENPFSLGAWIAGLALFAFAWIGRSIATGEASAPSTH